jgi:hypothetical protein
MMWKIIYSIYPPILRILEAFRFHSARQDFLLGTLNPKYTDTDLKNFLFKEGFSTAILAWRDPGEIFGLRMIDKGIFQRHIRLFKDKEIRGHYEYSSEGNPLNHVFENGFKDDREYFKSLLGDYLISNDN